LLKQHTHTQLATKMTCFRGAILALLIMASAGQYNPLPLPGATLPLSAFNLPQRDHDALLGPAHWKALRRQMDEAIGTLRKQRRLPSRRR